MMPMKLSAVLLLLQLNSYFGLGSCGKVLVWPMEYSHWINLKTILHALSQKDHEVTVLRSSAAVSLDVEKGSAIKFEDYPTSVSGSDWAHSLVEIIEKLIYELPKEPIWKFYSATQELTRKQGEFMKTLCKDIVLNKELMSKLQRSRFDVILADTIIPCSELLAEILNVPFVYTHRLFPGYRYEKYSGALPVPPSYVPIALSQLSDQMTFAERVKNMMYVLYFDFWFQMFNETDWNQFYSEVLGRPTTLFEIVGKADMWLIRTYWDLDFPRPSLPNFDFVGGLHCKPAKPLPKEMEDFVQSSGDHGVVLFSLGSMIMNMTEDRANVIASALAQIPQKVIWRYSGKKPATLGRNTQLYKWIPQNDLLGHPKTKAFITHGGTNGIYEAIYHGVPIVGIPLFWDQGDNVARMETKGAAVRLEFLTMSSADLVNAVKTVINDPSYKENVMRLSRIHHDQPVKPLDRAVFWIEFVMRHKGAKHLRVAAHDLSWFQYHSLDVIGFLLACVATVMFLITKCCLFCYRKFAKTGKQKKRE